MPNPLDYLRSAFNGATSSVIPQEYIDPALDAIDSPSLERSPWEARLRGFGAGAVQGLRDSITPANMLMALTGTGAANAVGQAARAGSNVGRAVSRVARPTLDIIEDIPVRQVKPAMDDVDSLIGDLSRNLAKIPSKGGRMPGPPKPATAGMRDPNFTPRGGEGAFNAGRPPLHSSAGGDGFHRTMLRRLGGRGEM